MLFYDYQRLFNKFGHSPRKFRENLTKVKGSDFLVNEDYVLLNPDGLSLRNLILYLELCSYRNYYDYIRSNEKDVPLIYLDDVDRYTPLLGNAVTKTKDKLILIQEK